MTSARILIVEDNRVVARDIQQQLVRIGHTIAGVTARGEDAVSMASESHADLVLMDIRLEGVVDGIDAAQQIRDRCRVPVVFLTSYADDETVRRASRTEPFGYLLKPFEDSQLRTVLEMALCKHAAERKLRESERRYAVTLASIGDAVIATDNQVRITFMNPAAQSLTGWTQADAMGRPLTEVFRIINEQTRETVEDPAAKVLRLGAVVGLANHTALVARDGRETPIDDCGSPIIDDRGQVTGVVLVFRDVSQRRKAEDSEAFQQAYARLELAFRGANTGVWDFDIPDGDLQRATLYAINCWEPLGFTQEPPSDLASRAELWHPDDRERVLTSIQACLNSRATEFEIECRMRHKDGSYRWRLNRGVVVRDTDGKPIRFIGSSIDITEHKEAEALLDAQKRILELVVKGEPLEDVLSALCRTFEQLNDGEMLTSILLLEPDGVHVRHGAAPSFPESYVKAIDGQAIGPRAGSCGTAAWRREPVYVSDIATDPLWEDYAELALSYGLRACWSTPIFSSTGDVLGTFAMYYRQPRQPKPCDLRGIDLVTNTVAIAIERSRAEQALKESEGRFRGTFENAAVGIAHCDFQGRYLLVNQKYCEIVGYSLAELLRISFKDLTHADDLPATMDKFLPLSRGYSRSYSEEKRILRKDGSIAWISVFASVQRNASGAPAHTIALIQDISERKTLEIELRHAKEAAEAANRAKDEFLANVSHEIRTPMNAILGMTDLVLDMSLTEDQRQCLQTVKSAADNLLAIINDLLDFSKIEAGKLELHLSPFSLRATVGDTLRTLAMRAHRKGLELLSNIEPDVPDALVGDAGRLRQVLLNLVGNAIKFTNQGEVVVTVRPASGATAAADKTCLHFVVQDTGIGIPADKQETIFRAFEQEDTSTTRKYGGTGLGLTIANQLAHLMGGNITVKSQPKHGSTFLFTARFQLQPNPPEASAAQTPVLLHNLRVLIVDDNVTNRRILLDWLGGWRMEPAAVGDGLAALDALWDAVTAGRPYALVLLDARMPDTDSLALAAKIRKRAELSGTRIVLLTSGDRPGDPARFRDLRIDGHMLKPARQDELLGLIYQVMNRAPSDPPALALLPGDSNPASTPTSAPLAQSDKALRILVAEDNEFSARLLELLLAQRGYEVQMVGNGREALTLATQGNFDLLLLDIHLPELDGFQIVRSIRRDANPGHHLPVIALTARSRKEDRDRCLAAGMDDYLSKPVKAADLWAAIDRITGAPPARRSGPRLIDARVLLAASGDNAQNLQEICNEFRAGLPVRLSAVQQAVLEQDAPRLREEAHSLHGMLAVFSTVAGDLASDLEDAAARGQLGSGPPLLEQLEAIASELLASASNISLQALRREADTADRDATARASSALTARSRFV